MFIHHFSDCVAPLADMCRKNLRGNVVHTETTKDAFETLKSRMTFAPVLLIPSMGHEAELVVEANASKVDIAIVLLQEDAFGLCNLKNVKHGIVPMIVRH